MSLRQKIEEEKKKKLKKIYPFWLFEPTPTQLLFLKSIFNEPKPDVVLFLSGNQSGKTTVNIIALIIFMTNSVPIGLQGIITPPNLSSGSCGRVIGTDYLKGLGKVYHPKMLDLLPPDALAESPKKNPSGVISEIRSKRGVVVDFLTYEQPSSIFEGWTGDFASFDEVPPRDKFIATKRGMIARDGIIFMTLTPPVLPEDRKEEYEWIYDEIYLRAQVDDKIKVIEGTTYDNIQNLSPSAIASFEKTLSEEEREARIFGKFVFNIGLIYKEFSMQDHIIEPFEIPKDWPVYVITDPHTTTPHHTIFVAVDREENLIQFDELISDAPIPEYVEKVKERIIGKKLKMAIMDASAQEKDPWTKMSMIDEFRKCGVFYIPAKKDKLEVGFSEVRRLLKEKKIKIFSTCTKTIRMFTHLTYSSKDDHLSDAWRYLATFPYRFKDDVYIMPQPKPIYISTGY